MKEMYTTPEMEIVEFETEDVITASGVDAGNAGNGGSSISID